MKGNNKKSIKLSKNHRKNIYLQSKLYNKQFVPKNKITIL